MVSLSREAVLARIPMQQLRKAAAERMDVDNVLQIQENYNRAVDHVLQEADSRGRLTELRGLLIGALVGFGIGGAIHLLGSDAKEAAKGSWIVMTTMTMGGGTLIGGIAGTMRASVDKIRFIGDSLAPLKENQRQLLADPFSDYELKLLLVRGHVQDSPQ